MGKRPGVNKSIRTRVLLRDEGACQKCGRRDHLNIHHIQAVMDGGSDDDSNLVTVCIPCHREWELAEMVMDIPFDRWLPLPSYDVLLMSVLSQGFIFEYKHHDEVLSIGEVYKSTMRCHELQKNKRKGLLAS